MAKKIWTCRHCGDKFSFHGMCDHSNEGCPTLDVCGRCEHPFEEGRTYCENNCNCVSCSHERQAWVQAKTTGW
jgi:hypothetical protein